MHDRSRRGLALLCATTALAGATLANVATAVAAPPPAPGLLDGVSLLLVQVTSGTVATVQLLIAPLGTDLVGDLLVAADPSQLTKLLAAATANHQLEAALDTLTAGELATVVDGLTAGQTGTLLGSADAPRLQRLLGALTSAQSAGGLATLNATQLTAIVSGLTNSQISGLLSAGGSGSVITGLLGRATSLAGGTPAATPVDTLVGQVDTVLKAGLPAQLTDLATLLSSTRSLLNTSGLGSAGLTSLLATANGLLASAAVPAPVAAPLEALAARLTELLTPVTGGGGGEPTGGGSTGAGGTGGGTRTPPATTTPTGMPTPTGTVTTTGPAATTRPATSALAPRSAGATFTAYRATFGPIKLNAKRTKLAFKLTCPASAPRGCAVTLNAKFAGQKAIRPLQLALPRGSATPVTVTISRGMTKRLKAKGGSLTLTAKTSGSSLTAATGKLKIKRAKRVR